MDAILWEDLYNGQQILEGQKLQGKVREAYDAWHVPYDAALHALYAW